MDTDGVTIREATRDDAGRIVDDLWFPLAREVASLNAYDELDDDVREDVLTYFHDLLDREDAVVFVAEDAGTLVGLSSAERRDPPPVFARGTEAAVNEVYVTEASRREGVATALLERQEAWAREHDCVHMTLSVPAGDDPARALYEEFGLDVVRHRMATRLD